MDLELKQRLTASDTWLRGLLILIFAVVFSISEIVLGAIVVFQFLAALFTGETNARLREFGMGLAAFLYQVISFITFNSDEKPFPFGPWPESEPLVREPRDN